MKRTKQSTFAKRERQETGPRFDPVGGGGMSIHKPAQFTPGPWAVEPRQWDHGASLAIVAPHNGYIVAVVPFDEDIQTVDEPDYETVKRHPDEVPNAHLLAAAPAMYEALTNLLPEEDIVSTDNGPDECRWCGRTYLDNDNEGELQVLCTFDDCPGYIARQAIAQAEGRQG